VLEGAKNTLLLLSALFPIVNPLGGSPIFLTLTSDYSGAARRALSARTFFHFLGFRFRWFRLAAVWLLSPRAGQC
jgi:small neutral amino acid transporter SnatA (MarC family)